MNKPQQITEFDFTSNIKAGLLVCAGGFENRSMSFLFRLRKSRCQFEHTIVLHYESQQEDNERNFKKLTSRLQVINKQEPETVSVNAARPIMSISDIKASVQRISSQIDDRTAIVDISGMTHLWAIGTINACITCGFQTSVIYTEARWYFPLKRDWKPLVNAWNKKNYDKAAKYLQSAALNNVFIQPEFNGNFRPGFKNCLIVFAGFEPNRIKGLVDLYAPNAIIVLYGKSPHQALEWRTKLSKELHRELFHDWYVRETEISTFLVDEILFKLEEEFHIIKEHYDIAISPHCSKMQGLATYLFWRKHPEVQLLFTSPVRFNPNRYSKGARTTFIYDIED